MLPDTQGSPNGWGEWRMSIRLQLVVRLPRMESGDMDSRVDAREDRTIGMGKVVALLAAVALVTIVALAWLWIAPASMPTSMGGDVSLSSVDNRRALAVAGMVSVAGLGIVASTVCGFVSDKRRLVLRTGILLILVAGAGFGIAAIGHGV
ncbi:hypothetical protein FFA01_22690 [Frigoribacterium faeni]|uniref:Major facilitator superfamily (MFS) profile domain-containing protein n=2 Tax=Frigoribacterium faeni TaxID=145483 RepID=A0ABQ0UR61_9MICO|nr:hypothetical protein FFA01_22690 [Frigoribacterium faeni]